MDDPKRAVLKALSRVVDPEAGLDIVAMGLIYGLEVGPEEIRLTLTLTTRGCPLGETIVRLVRESMEGVAGARRVRLDLAWDPPWDPRMLNAEGRGALGGRLR